MQDQKEITQINSEAEFKSSISGKVVVVDFYADWCGPCKVVAPKYAELASMYPNANFYKVNIDELSDLVDVKAIPTFVVYKQSKEFGRIVGVNLMNLEKLVREALGS